jgi:metallo-beta-lactamase family protein
LAKNKKKKQNILVSFVDEPASEGVTGSLVYVETPNHKILLDAGFYQSNDTKVDYDINNRNYKGFKVKQIDTIILSHNHGDHIFLAPVLYKKGCNATTYVPAKSSKILQAMLTDCAYINERDIEMLNKRLEKSYQPLFDNDDIDRFMNHVVELPVKQKIKIDDELTIQFIYSGHLTNGCQIELYVTTNNRTQKILYTGDLGNKFIPQPFTEILEYVEKANLVIAESTYAGRKDLKTTMKERQADLNKLKKLVLEQVVEKQGRLVIPVFAQARAQTLVFLLWKLFGKDKNFKTKIYVDSPLACKVFEIYLEILEGPDKAVFEEMLTWENLVFVKDSDMSKALVSSKEPCVVLSSSGMCNNGRVKHHIKSIINDENATILFVGYAGEGTLADNIKKNETKIVIDGEEYLRKCNWDMLTSLSSHITYFGMTEYYGSINCNKLVLHHGDKEGQYQLKKDLNEIYTQKCRTTNVIIANKDLKLEM